MSEDRNDPSWEEWEELIFRTIEELERIGKIYDEDDLKVENFEHWPEHQAGMVRFLRN